MLIFKALNLNLQVRYINKRIRKLTANFLKRWILKNHKSRINLKFKDMKTIAFLLDDLDTSRELIRYAVLLAKDLKANVQVVFVQSPPVIYGEHDFLGTVATSIPQNILDYDNSVKIKAEKIIEELQKEISEETNITFSLEEGSKSQILTKKVETGEIDMVMLTGQTNQSAWTQTLSNIDIIRNVKCPVWIIAPNSKYQPLKKIIYATDHQKEDIPTLKRLLALTRVFNPEIIALHVSDNIGFEGKIINAGFKEMIKMETGSDTILLKNIVNENNQDVTEILNKEAAEINADLIVVLQENKNFLERIFESSFTKELISQTQIPVLIFHEK
jgi:nucleotide-binding universal stress UspA family protein